MNSSKKRQKPAKTGIKSNHTAKKGSMMIYVILFVVVSILMITINQNRKRGVANTQNSKYSNGQTNPNLFTKEGELKFLNAAGDLVTEIDIEIADDDMQTTQGLMYRRSMKPNRGMLFIFPDVEERSFWMKNTLLSLDIMYLNANKEIVSISENAPPKSEESIWSEVPAKYVVEVNAGFVSQYQIKVGDRITFKRVY